MMSEFCALPFTSTRDFFSLRHMNPVFEWFRRTLNNTQVIILMLVILATVVGLYFFGKFLVPVLAAIVLAYLLEGLVTKLNKYLRLPRLGAVLIVFSMFMVGVLLTLFALIPFIINEVVDFSGDLPELPGKIQEQADKLPQMFPQFFAVTTNVVTEISTNYVPVVVTNLDMVVTSQVPFEVANTVTNISSEGITDVMAYMEQNWFKNSFRDAPSMVVASVPRGIRWGVTVIIYAILVPILVFFFLKDKERISKYLLQFLPNDHSLASQVWGDLDLQLSNYVRGKFVEILIVWLVSFIVFDALEVNYAGALSLFTGLSVLLPYVGATFMAVPVVLVSLFQVYPEINFWYPIIAYGVIQLLDGNLLAPLLLSNVTNIHPIAIIAAILVFGGIWGFWGVFFAIPLATLVNAIIHAWPKGELEAIVLKAQESPNIGELNDDPTI